MSKLEFIMIRHLEAHCQTPAHKENWANVGNIHVSPIKELSTYKVELKFPNAYKVITVPAPSYQKLKGALTQLYPVSTITH